MSIDKSHSEQYQRYLEGQMSPEEAHAFERRLLDDPFAQEALEGFEAHGADSINDLKKLRQKLSIYKKKPFPFLRVAAVITFLMVASFSVYLFTDQIETDPLAMDEESMDEIVQSAPAPDTLLLSDSIEPEEEELIVAEDEQVVALKMDEQRSGDKDQEIVKAEKETQGTDDLLAEDLSDEVFAEVEEDEIPENETSGDRDDFLNTIQSRRAETVVAEAIIEPVEPSLDTLILDTEVVDTHSFIAKEQPISNDAASGSSSRAKKAQPAAISRSTAASETIVGRITDDIGEPLPGVNVVIKGTTTGVTTDLDGYFELQKFENQTLIVSYVGFESQEIAVGDRSYVDVVLGGATELSEVVVTGYGETNEPRYSPARPSVGNMAYKEYIEKNLNYPEAAIANEIEGTVVLQLTIDPIGRVTNIAIKKSLGFGCDEEAIRLINDGPSWRGAKKDGKGIEDKLKVRVKFKLD